MSDEHCVVEEEETMFLLLFTWSTRTSKLYLIPVPESVEHDVDLTSRQMKSQRCVEKGELTPFPPHSSKVHHHRHGVWKHRALLQRLQQMAPRVPDPVLSRRCSLSLSFLISWMYLNWRKTQNCPVIVKESELFFWKRALLYFVDQIEIFHINHRVGGGVGVVLLYG